MHVLAIPSVPAIEMVVLPTEVDAANADQLRRLLFDCPPTSTVYVSGSACTFLDSSGMSVLCQAARRQREAGGRLYVVRPSPAVRRVLDLTGLRPLIAPR